VAWLVFGEIGAKTTNNRDINGIYIKPARATTQWRHGHGIGIGHYGFLNGAKQRKLIDLTGRKKHVGELQRTDNDKNVRIGNEGRLDVGYRITHRDRVKTMCEEKRALF